MNIGKKRSGLGIEEGIDQRGKEERGWEIR
jgi:hypothetical protein